MKRLMPQSLITFLQANPNCLKADLFVVNLPTTTTMFVTEGMFDITVPSGTPGWTGPTTTFLASKFGKWNRGPITSEASFGLSSNSMALTCIPQQGTAFPGLSVPILNCAFNGLFDRAEVTVYTCYMPLNQSENLCVWSQDLTQSAWTKTNSGASNPTVSISGSVFAPDGTLTSSAVVFPTVGSGDFSRVQQLIPVVPANSTVTFGIWLMASAATPIRMEVISNVSPFTGSTQAVNVTTSWQFFQLSNTWSSDLGTGTSVNFELSNALPGVTVYAWGAQAVAGPVLSNYVMTSANAVRTGSVGIVSAGIETKFTGFIENIKDIDRTHVEFEVQDPMYLLNENIPKRTIQSPCPWSFADNNCAISGGAAAYTVSFAAASSSTPSSLVPATAFTQAAGYFTQGSIVCTAGQNLGLRQTVKLHTGGQLQMTLPWILPVAAGDTFSVIKGCDKTATMCAASIEANGTSVDNLIHFGGMIDVPPQTMAAG